MRTLIQSASRAVVGALALGALPLQAQLGSPNPAPGPQQTVAIRNARIVPVVGAELASGTIVFSAGKITAIGANVSVPAGAQVIDGTGLSVYPGMMDAGTSMGLAEIPQGANATMDASEVGSFNPNSIAYYGITPHSAHIGVTRVVGITHVLSSPSGGIVSGQASLVNLAGWTPAAMSVQQKAGLVITLPRAGGGGFGFGGGFGGFGGGANNADATRQREKQLDSLKALIADARAYAQALDASAKDKSIPRPVADVKLDAMLPYVRGQLPVLFQADRAVDIKASVDFASEQGLTAIIVGGREAPEQAALLKAKNVPVLYGTLRNLPSREDDAYDINYSAPAKLAAAGVRFAITAGDGGAEVRDLPHIAGMAAAFGLSKEDALKSVTLWPAQITGIGDRFGSLEVGKVANLVVVDGDLLEARTNTKYLFIDGRAVSLENRHTTLYNTHKDRR
ncbi:MAG: amidohydrolase family protein [Gemmatimonadaceae bacterium]|nr:amidohydrolase family protein [Gemmatimonadaceae bacterium]